MYEDSGCLSGFQDSETDATRDPRFVYRVTRRGIGDLGPRTVYKGGGSADGADVLLVSETPSAPDV